MSPDNMVTWISVFCLEAWTDMIKNFLLWQIIRTAKKKKSFKLLSLFFFLIFSVTWEKLKVALEIQLDWVLFHSFSCCFGMNISEASGIFYHLALALQPCIHCETAMEYVS